MSFPDIHHLKKVAAVFAIFFYTTSSLMAQCVASGPNNGSAFSNNSVIGTLTWSNVTNAQTSDNIYASNGVLLGVLGSAQTNYMSATGFGLSIPATATVCGIEVTIERNASGLLIGSSIVDNTVYIIKSGGMIGTNKASGSAWPGSDGVATYGSNSDTWGTTWTPADINASNFGVAMSAKMSAGLASLFLTANVDAIGIKVYYNSTLPIEVLSFTGHAESRQVALNWTTLSEANNDYFMVEKMAADYSWQPVQKVNGAGNSVHTINYSAMDLNPQSINYYRLRQVDFSQQESFSQVIAVSYDEASSLPLLLSPVPAGSTMQVQVKDMLQHIEVYSSAGKLIVTEVPVAGESRMLSLHTGTLVPGLYYLRAYTDQGTYEQKFIKD